MNKTLLTVVIIILVVLGVWYFMTDKSVVPNEDGNATTTDSTLGTATTTDATATTTSDATVTATTTTTASVVKEFAMAFSSFKFSVNEIKVTKGDTVRLKITNTAGTHNIVIDGYGVESKTLSKAGETDMVEFVADKAGTFDYYCDIGTHRQMGMAGKLIVQ